MENLTYTPIDSVLQLNKAGELIQKRMKAVKVCDGLYITEPDKSGYTQFICELNGVVWLDCKAAENRIADGIKLMPGYFDKIKAGCFDGENFPEFKREISRRINHPDSPAIMELKKPERKKPAPLPEGAKKVGVIMFKGCTDEIIDKKVIINEVAPHVYTHTYKLKRYGERVKIIFEIDGVYFQGADNGAYVIERDDFNEICAKAYERARENVADGAAKGMRYFVEVQKRIDAATSSEVAQTDDTDAAITLPNEDINYMFYIKPKGAKRFSTYNPGKGTMNTGRVFTELYRKEHLPAVCKWIAEDMSGDFAYQLRSGDGKRIFWEHNPTAATPAETARIVRVEIVRDFDKSYYANLYDENGGGHNLSKEYTDFRTLTSLCKKEYGVNLPDLSQMEFETHGRKSYAYISTETPQNSTETAVAGNVSAKEENTAETAKYRISRFGGYKIIIGNREQGRVIAILMSVNGHNTIEISDESASIATMGEEPLQIDKPIMQLSDAEVLKLIYGSTEPPQSPETPQTIKHTTRTDKPRETARKEPRRTISKMERVHARQKLGVQGYSMFADASVILAAINVPPIRGDCIISVFQRAKPPNCASREKINIL